MDENPCLGQRSSVHVGWGKVKCRAEHTLLHMMTWVLLSMSRCRRGIRLLWSGSDHRPPLGVQDSRVYTKWCRKTDIKENNPIGSGCQEAAYYNCGEQNYVSECIKQPKDRLFTLWKQSTLLFKMNECQMTLYFVKLLIFNYIETKLSATNNIVLVVHFSGNSLDQVDSPHIFLKGGSCASFVMIQWKAFSFFCHMRSISFFFSTKSC